MERDQLKSFEHDSMVEAKIIAIFQVGKMFPVPMSSCLKRTEHGDGFHRPNIGSLLRSCEVGLSAWSSVE